MIRGTYGPEQPYTEMAARAMQLWQKHEWRYRTRLFQPIGVLWMAYADDQFERRSLPVLRECGIRFYELSPRQLKQRWPQVNFDDVAWGIYEPGGGYLRARDACQSVAQAFVGEGGKYLQQMVKAPASVSQSKPLKLADGSQLTADDYVFAAGPWLGKLFPKELGRHIQVTKQDVFFFGTPAGTDRFNEDLLPVWADHRGRFMYGIPANQGRGFKIGDDTRGAPFDPTSDERIVNEERLQAARDYLAFRFPGMSGAPLVETRVCQYENTADHDFIIDRLPKRHNVLIAGGGSGHAFKHGPVIGEMVAGMLLDDQDPHPRFALARFK